MKIHTVAAGMLCLIGLTAGACVTPSTYNEVVADLDATKGELDSTNAQSKVLIEQVNELQQLKTDLARQMETASLALQQATQQIHAEHTAAQERLRRLTRTISQLTAQQKQLLYALQRANEERPGLQSMVEEYKSKLSGADGVKASVSPPPIAPTNEQAGTAVVPPAHVAAQADPASRPTVTTPVAPTDPAAVNSKPQPPNKPTSDPVEDDWLSILKGWVITFWQSLF